MDLKNKYLLITLRILFGVFLLFSGISGLVMGPHPEGIPEAFQVVNQVYWDTGILQLAKVTEIVAGLMFVTNFLPALAALLAAPLTVGILVFNLAFSPATLGPGIIVALFEAYFGYVYWDKYKALFERK